MHEGAWLVHVKNVLDENVSVEDDARSCELCVLQYTSRRRTLSLAGTEILRYKQTGRSIELPLYLVRCSSKIFNKGFSRYQAQADTTPSSYLVAINSRIASKAPNFDKVDHGITLSPNTQVDSLFARPSEPTLMQETLACQNEPSPTI